jgi:hypothetical protein
LLAQSIHYVIGDGSSLWVLEWRKFHGMKTAINFGFIQRVVIGQGHGLALLHLQRTTRQITECLPLRFLIPPGKVFGGDMHIVSNIEGDP